MEKYELNGIFLGKGMKTSTKSGGTLTILDEDRLCFSVFSENKNTRGIRTLSKPLILEFIDYIKRNPDVSSPKQIRDELSGRSAIDRYEYGYDATLYALALLSIDNEKNHPEKFIKKGKRATITIGESGQYIPYLAAIRTKPFLLLAGLSGTGKSRIVRELARSCWPVGDANRDKQLPDNFMIIPVKPNWHDSSELIGYRSSYQGEHYVIGDFLRAVAKAWELRDRPYFVCLDEMNLAPVEQYFAEYLSVIESRRIDAEGNITTDPIVRVVEEQWFYELANKITEDGDFSDWFKREGISLPPNLVVVGTVNMDETTYSFSRKVLDRAMTIEMNEVNLWAGIGEEADVVPDLSGEGVFRTDMLTAEDVYIKGSEEQKQGMKEVVEWLEDINGILEGSPFKIAYRTRNEIVLYVINSEMFGQDRLLAFDQAVCMKILPRIEGDQKKVGKVLEGMKGFMKNLYAGVCEDGQRVSSEALSSSPSFRKLEEMEGKITAQYYCSYWS